MVPSATESRGIFVLRKTVVLKKLSRKPQGVGDALPLRALEAHELEELEDILAGSLVDDLPIGEEDDVIEEFVSLREGKCFPNSHLPDVEIILADTLTSEPSFPERATSRVGSSYPGSFSRAAHFSASSSSSSLDDLEKTSSVFLQLFRLRLPAL
ncbi:unnamed protein product [Spirodela intermedia]|uniref:Uncharacterized protein n=1 Tax=Spirodela intermedia TaxID=51605 RepID=A0A7I8LE63_SPIIN|nr:unnamed protein product [Spirodela intermedia]